MAEHTCTEQLTKEFKTLRVDGEIRPTVVLTAQVKRISEISDTDLREWVTVEEGKDNKRIKMTIQMNVVNPPAWMSDPASVEMCMLNEAVSGMMMGNPAPAFLETASAPAEELDGACVIFEEAAKRQRRFAQVIQDAFEGSDPRIAAQEIMVFSATEVETTAYGTPFAPEEGAPVVTVTAVPDAFELEAYHGGIEDDINGFYGMGTSDSDVTLVDFAEEAPRWSYLDRFRNRRPAPVEASPARIDLMADPCYRSFLTTILKDAMKMGDQPTINKLTTMGVDPDYDPPVLPPSPCFLVEEQNAVVA